DCPVNYHRMLEDTVAVDVAAVETVRSRQLEVQLHSAELPLPAESVINQDVDLRPIERTVAFRDDVVAAADMFVEHLFQGGFRSTPALDVADEAFRRPGAEAVRVLHIEQAVEVAGNRQDVVALRLDLLGRGEDMRIILLELLHAQKSMQSARGLMAV